MNKNLLELIENMTPDEMKRRLTEYMMADRQLTPRPVAIEVRPCGKAGVRYRYDVLPESVAQRYDSLLDAQGLTREEAERSLDYYSQHLDAYQRIHDSVVARLEVINKTLPAVVPTRIVTGTDSVQRTIPKLVLPKQKALDPQM